MGLFGGGSKVNYVTQQTKSADKEAEKAKAKQRLLETEGKANGAELNANQGRSVRRIFG